MTDETVPTLAEQIAAVICENLFGVYRSEETANPSSVSGQSLKAATAVLATLEAAHHDAPMAEKIAAVRRQLDRLEYIRNSHFDETEEYRDKIALRAVLASLEAAQPMLAAERIALLEECSEAAHNAWLDEKRRRLGDVTTWPNERGIEQLVPWSALSEDVREFDRIVVGAIMGVLETKGLALAAYDAAPKPALEAAQWRSIKTAPKDGTPILVYRGPAPSKKREYGVDSFGTVESYPNDWACSSQDQQPAHWMPLPSPPAPPTTAATEE